MLIDLNIFVDTISYACVGLLVDHKDVVLGVRVESPFSGHTLCTVVLAVHIRL